LGLAQVPELMADPALASQHVTEVLRRFAPVTPGIFLYHPGRKQMLPKLRAFIDHVRSVSGSRVRA
jgi:DNA-binding transcriptional LysR family regulator